MLKFSIAEDLEEKLTRGCPLLVDVVVLWQVTTKINDMMSKTSSTGALDAFNRMEEKARAPRAPLTVFLAVYLSFCAWFLSVSAMKDAIR